MSVPKRFFVEKVGGEVVLTGEEYRHARNVLRLGVGDEVTLLDGSGKEYPAVVARAEKGALVLNTLGERAGEKEPLVPITLLVGALKGDKTELVVQKAAELGASRVAVFSSRNCAAYMNENKLARLTRVAHEAAKQCLRSRAPEVVYYANFAEALSSARDAAVKLFACEFLEESGGGIAEHAPSYAVVVGSEGGFTREEYALAQELGYTGISLGKRILRAETAAVALLALTARAAGELG